MDSLLARLAAPVTTARTLEDLVRPLLAMAREVTRMDSAYLAVLDPATQRLSVVHADNAGALHIREGGSAAFQDTLCHHARDAGIPFVDDAPRRWPDCDGGIAQGARSHLSIPVRLADRAFFGTLCAASADRTSLPPDAVEAMRLLAVLIARHVERERLRERLRDVEGELATAALTDPLTGLPNRQALAEELGRMLARAQRDGMAVFAALVAIDRPAAVAQPDGAAGAEDVWRAVARSLSDGLRGGDLVGRYGDGFAVVGTVPQQTAGASAGVVHERLVRQLAARPDTTTAAIRDHVRVGLAVARVGEFDAAQLLARAEASMRATAPVPAGLHDPC